MLKVVPLLTVELLVSSSSSSSMFWYIYVWKYKCIGKELTVKDFVQT